jgi:DNA-binding phage protein
VIDYKDNLYQRLKIDIYAVNYLQEALEESDISFLIALKKVLEARGFDASLTRKILTLAEKAGLSL